MNKPTVKIKRRRFTEAERREIVDEYKSGSMSQAHLASTQGISASTLQNWLRRYRPLRKAVLPGKLLPVRVLHDSCLSDSLSPDRSFEITLNSHRKIRVPSGFDTEEVKNLVRILEETC